MSTQARDVSLTPQKRKQMYLWALGLVLIMWLGWRFVQWTNGGEGRVEIPELQERHTITLMDPDGNSFATDLSMHWTGYIDGQAWLTGPGISEKLSGPVDLSVHSEFYASTAQFEYDPIDVKGGHLEVWFDFYSPDDW